jgi:ankyrin repeat protein
MSAADKGHIATVQLLHQLGADFNAVNNVRTDRRRASAWARDRAAQEGWTAPMLAAEEGLTEMVELLARLGANVKATRQVWRGLHSLVASPRVAAGA